MMMPKFPCAMMIFATAQHICELYQSSGFADFDPQEILDFVELTMMLDYDGKRTVLNALSTWLGDRECPMRVNTLQANTIDEMAFQIHAECERLARKQK
jgi:hypothetical protein